MKISGWGRFPRLDCRITTPRGDADVRMAVASGRNGGPGNAPVIARGNGRSYGDSALQPCGTLDMRRMNRLLSFDPSTGQLVAEAGVLLADIITAFLPRGWWPVVTPGTRFVTLGGMIAADVHGKNHHRDGSFGHHLDWIDVMGQDGRVLRCSPEEDPDLFAATIGGMGLTGIILRAAFRLRPVESGWIRQQSLALPDLASTLDAFDRHAEAAYSVAWIDCLAEGADLGRSILTIGDHASRADLPRRLQKRPFDVPARRNLTLPVDLPGFLLNRHSVRLFNHSYYQRHAGRAGSALVGWESFFYPLDALSGWNRLYGRRGFVQYQCVLPLAASATGLRALISRIAASGRGSFLAVLKRMGPEGRGRISFPMEGYTLALDFPATPAALALLRELDAIVLAHGGRFYLAKDSRLAADTLARSDARIDAFRAFRAGAGLPIRFQSRQSERLCL